MKYLGVTLLLCLFIATSCSMDSSRGCPDDEGPCHMTDGVGPHSRSSLVLYAERLDKTGIAKNIHLIGLGILAFALFLQIFDSVKFYNSRKFRRS